MKNGIAIGGNILVDYLKQIDVYPDEGMLAITRSQGMSVGGCVCNTGISLKRLAPSMDVQVIGCIGSDSAGEYVHSVFSENNLDTTRIIPLDTVPTGYTDVFLATKTNTRTFFVNMGANNLFNLNHMDFDRLDMRILHMGYILLLETMDSPDSDYGTVMARVLSEAQRRGVKTSIDVVSEVSDRYTTIVPPSLKYCNYAILNEIEAGKTVGISPRAKDGSLIWESLPVICEKIIDMGVKDHVIVHCPETGIIMDSKKKWTGMRSLCLSDGYIKGSVGSGDAFCAGTLFGLYNELSPEELLRLSNSAAAGCLSAEDGTSGVGTTVSMMKLHEQYSVADEKWTG